MGFIHGKVGGVCADTPQPLYDLVYKSLTRVKKVSFASNTDMLEYFFLLFNFSVPASALKFEKSVKKLTIFMGRAQISIFPKNFREYIFFNLNNHKLEK